MLTLQQSLFKNESCFERPGKIRRIMPCRDEEKQKTPNEMTEEER